MNGCKTRLGEREPLRKLTKLTRGKILQRRPFPKLNLPRLIMDRGGTGLEVEKQETGPLSWVPANLSGVCNPQRHDRHPLTTIFVQCVAGT